MPMAYSALALTAVNLLLRLLSTGFGVYLSRTIGPAGMGLLQLTMSVGTLAMVAGVGGIRTATLYLTAEEMGKNHPEGIAGVLSGGFVYSLMLSLSVSLGLWILAPQIGELLLKNPEVVPALRLFAVLLPVSCLGAVMQGAFTALGRIGILTAVSIGEQLLSMGVSLALLSFRLPAEAGNACLAVITGSGVGAGVSLAAFALFHTRRRLPDDGAPYPFRKLMSAAVPLAAADFLRSGIHALENILVPRRLALNPDISSPLASFGVLEGMVFPALMFPACILFGLSELLIPELARCSAAGNTRRIHHLTRKVLVWGCLYGCIISLGMLLLAEPIGAGLYKTPEAGGLLRRYAPLCLMLYCDIVTDAMIKGLGQQRKSVFYNIVTNSLDVLILYYVLPKFGLNGYFWSFFITHAVNFALSIRLLLRIAPIFPANRV